MFAGLAVSLILHLLSFLQTRRNRKKDVALAEFKDTVRAPIFNALIKIRSVQETLSAQSLTSPGPKKQSALADIQANEFMPVIEELYVALKDASEHSMTNGNNWHEIPRECEEVIISAFDKLSNTNTTEEQQQNSFREIDLALDTILKDIKRRTEHELKKLT